MPGRSIIVLALTLTLFACSSEPSVEDGSATQSRSPSIKATALPSDAPTFAKARILIDTDEGSVLVDAELAENQEQWSYGLMNRTSLPEDAGMAFLFFHPVNASFYMKDTLIPLSIAFFDDDGVILDIQDMDPCEDDPCPLFGPGRPFSGALEVNEGAFDDWGVKPGDRITISH